MSTAYPFSHYLSHQVTPPSGDIILNNINNLMGEEAMRIDDGIADWEAGLPSADDLMPLSQSLIPAELASAFKITAEPSRSMLEVNRASETTLSSLRSVSNLKPLGDDYLMSEWGPPEESGGSDPKRSRRTDDEAIENCASGEQGKAVKRPRLVWTPQLHKRFVDVVAHLGLKNAVPKTIMQLMNVEGLTRENVASHLQKYRLYVRRMQGLSNDGPSSSDHLFAATPLPPSQSFNESSSGHGTNGTAHKNSSYNNGSSGGNNGHAERQTVQMPMMEMAVASATSIGGFNGNEAGNSYYHHHHHHHHYAQQYSNMMQQQLDWTGNQYSNAHSRHVTQNDK